LKSMNEVTAEAQTHSTTQVEQPTRFMTMGISKVSEHEACVAAIRLDGIWVRPETPTLAEIRADNSAFVYFRWANAVLAESIANDPRPEDHHIVRAPLGEEELSLSARAEFLRKHTDPSAGAAFAGERSMGLIRATVHRVYMKQSTAKRIFLRAEFTDAAGERYDWIVTEVRLAEEIAPYLVDGQITAGFGEKLCNAFNSAETYFTIALTKPNNRFPGKFRGCHPVIVGIHTVPDYTQQLAADSVSPDARPE
jgi:hypothetical protein